MQTYGLAALAAFFALPVAAHDGVAVREATLLVAGPAAKSAGAFMRLENHSTSPDRLVSAASPAAQEVQIHSGCETAEGVMRMTHLADGIALPGESEHRLARGGDHVMLMGLAAPLAQGDRVPLTLTFERTGEMVVEFVVAGAASDAVPVVAQSCDGAPAGAAAGHSSH